MEKKLIKTALIISAAILIFDLIYKTVFQITYLTKENCIFYQFAPRPLFLIYESFIELFLLVFVGIFIAFFLEEKFSKNSRFYPKNIFTAFVYAAILPVCACMAIPIIGTLRKKISLKVLITFIIAAPILSPQIIVLSLVSLGIEYTVLRILFAFIVAASTGIIIELLYKKKKFSLPPFFCNYCQKNKGDIYTKTMYFFKQLLPFILLAGLVNVAIELIGITELVSFTQVESILGTIIILLIGIPIYFCGGTEIILIRPFLMHGIIGLGTAAGFSVTSTAICIASIAMLIKIIGKKATLVMTTLIFLISFILATIVNMII